MLKRLLITISLFASFCLAWAQGGVTNISGIVVDDAGLPLPGVTVYEDGNMSNGTVTDTKGTFSLKTSSQATLVFSSLGYNEAREKLSGRNSLKVVLKEESLTLDAVEVVAVGYGSVARRDLTGSVSKLDMEGITKSSPANFDQAIAGRIAGVVVSSSDGAVGSESNIVIRGNNSLTQSSEPLYVIDGFPTESSFATSLNPADIESVDVLKDASAAAIYGARGANGVIVITTKKGVEGKTKINFSASMNVSNIAKKVELLNAYDFVQLHEDYCQASGVRNIYFIDKDENGSTIYDAYTLEDYRNVKSMDWQDQIYRTALSQDYNISISGGNSKVGNRYNISFALKDQDGILRNSEFKRYNGKVSLSQRITEKVNLDLNLNYSKSITLGNTPASSLNASSSSAYLMYSVWGYRPVKPIYLGDVSEDFLNSLIDTEIVNPDDNRFNPAASVRNEYKRRVFNYLSANAALNYDIIPGLRLRVTGGYVVTDNQAETFNNENTSTGWSGSSLGWGINGSIYYTKSYTWLNENTLNWTKTVAKHHHIQALAGLTFQHQDHSYNGIKSHRMTTAALGLNGLHTGEYQTVTPYSNNWGLMSWLGRFNYNYRYIYYLTASFRADGSSKFPIKNRWGFFPSASLAWNFNREDFLKQYKWFNTGKLRLSWGLTGNNRTSTPYDFYSQITTSPGTTATYDYVYDGKIVPGYYPSNMENNDLRWETTSQWDLGLDLAFFDNRIKFTADLYQKDTRDLLLKATLPSSSGYTSAMINIGAIRNRGLELSLELVPVRTAALSWVTGFNMAVNRNSVTALVDDQYSLVSSVTWDMKFSSQYPYITQVGKPTGMMFGYIYEGTYKPDEFLNGETLRDGLPYLASLQRTSIRPGDPKYRDINGDGLIDEEDRTIIGCGQPLLTGGWSNTITWHGFDLSAMFQWSFGNDVVNANRLIFENSQGTHLNQFSTMKNCWHAERNPDSDIPRVRAGGMYVYSSRVVEDGSYIRLKTLSLGYTLPAKIASRIRMSNMRVFVTAENLLTISSYSGPDPEVSTRNSVLTPGFDWSAYPRAKGVTFGFSTNF